MADENGSPSIPTETDPSTTVINHLEIEQLFNTSWFPSQKLPACHHSKQAIPTSQSTTIDFFKKYLPFVLYVPFGCVITTLRLCILLQFMVLLLVLPRALPIKQKAIRLMFFLLGVTYSVEGESRSNTAAGNVLVSNHITILDHFIIHVITNSVTQLKLAISIPSYVLARFGLTCDIFSTKEDISELQEPLVLFPELESTNGQAGLLAFDSFPMLEGHEVTPIGLKVSRSLLNVNTVQNGLASELFLLIFLPNTHFTLRFLPPQPWNPQIVQECIATTLKLLPTRYNASDKSEYIKKINFRPPSLTTMARLVQQQLHPVILSTETILSTLQRTGSVEKTVEELRKSMAEPSFHKSATERMMNFQERKRLMIENARKKYCEKHGLQF